MGHIPVPWFIGGAADHSAEVARLLAYNATGGREGIIGQSDCRVLSLQTPGPAIRVMPGAYNILVQSQKYGMYLGMLDSEDVVNTTPTGSGSGRSDLVCLRVENPTVAGEPWDMPNDPENGPYVRTVIIEGVPSSTRKFSQLGLLDSAIAVARIDFPPSTATVTQSMIKDLRSGAVDAEPGEDGPGTPPAAAAQTVYRIIPSTQTVAANNISWLYKNDSTFRTWPAHASWNVPVPSWATFCEFEVQVVNAKMQYSNIVGEMRFKLGEYGYAYGSWFDENPGWPLDTQSSVTLPLGSNFTVAPGMRGKTINFSLESRIVPQYTGTNSRLFYGAGSYVKLFMIFKTSPTL